MGVDAATVQRILRHSSISVTTGIYLEVIERVQRDAVDKMNTFLEVTMTTSSTLLRSPLRSKGLPSKYGREPFSLVELRGLEPLTLTLPV